MEKYWVGFNLVPGIGPIRFKTLLAHCGDAERAWHASATELQAAGLDRRSLQNFLKTRAGVSLEKEMEKIARAGVRLLTWDDPAYPPHLCHIYDPPFLLYVKGELLEADEWAVAMVGTRRASVYGKEVTKQLAGDLARNQVTVVSGLASGIDTEAHRAALEAGGRTIAVLGNGIDIIYPQQNAALSKRVVEAGALISEFPLGTRPEGRNFPRRNRIISGMALGTVVTEAGPKSGALITAGYALEQGRDIFAVPGNILARQSQGTNELIRDGATPVLSVEDILQGLNLSMISQHQEVRAIVPENETESALLTYLSANPAHIDEIVRQSGLPTALVSSTLSMMELKGMVRQVEGMNYVLARESKASYVVE
jgi:DNA processing protein